MSPARCTSQAISDTSGSQKVKNSVSVSPKKPVTLKYKRIQPKPVSYSSQNDTVMDASSNYSNIGSGTNILETIDYCETFIRSSTTTLPVSAVSCNEIHESSSSPSSSSNHDEKGLGKSQIKRHYEAGREHHSSSKKRLLATIESSSCSKAILDSNSSTDGTPRSDGSNSTASLSPILTTATFNSSLNASVNNMSYNNNGKRHANISSSSSSEMCIKLQELECDALNDDINDNCNSNMDLFENDCNPNTLSQLRLLLEKNLPKSKSISNGLADDGKSVTSCQSKSFDCNLAENIGVKPENQEGNAMNRVVSSINSSSIVSDSFMDTRYIADKSNHKAHCDVAVSSLADKCIINFGNLSDSTTAPVTTTTLSQNPSIPSSPNSRRQAFSFQPISQRVTPTIPENNTMIYNSYGSVQGRPSPPYNSNQRSIGVGLSQPPSSANSPFVSPRDTPIPISRSRHDSGQSSYSTSRQTPYPVVDSGLSSISSSPFISPQSTPVPLSRIRASTNNLDCYRRNIVNRARHSSGPGNPFTSLPQNMKSFTMRSSSVSPMVNTNGDTNLNGNSYGITNTHLVNQGSINGHSTVNNNGTPASPMSEPLSPSNVFTSTENLSSSDLSLVNHCESVVDSGFDSREWLSSTGSSQSVQSFNSSTNTTSSNPRQRHFSSPYATFGGKARNTNSFSCNFKIDCLSLGNYSDSMALDSDGRPQLNRCHSVPVQHQIATSSSSYHGSEMVATPSISSMEMSPDSQHSASKSYPPTPVCTNSFQFPSSPSTNGMKMVRTIQEDDTPQTFLEGAHDVMVSGIQSTKEWSASEMDMNVNNDNLTGHSPFNYDLRRTVDENNSPSTPLDLGPLLEDLRDCDNDFSKFTLDFELGAEEPSNTIGDM